jgi:Na+-driven multidrug efflux pump
MVRSFSRRLLAVLQFTRSALVFTAISNAWAALLLRSRASSSSDGNVLSNLDWASALWMLLISVWFGLGDSAKVAFVALVVFFPVVVNTYEGIRGVPKQLIEVSRVLMFSKVRLIRSVILQASFTSFLFLGAGLGDVTLAANQVLLLFLEITAYALDGFAFAAEALVGQALGALRRDDLRRSAILASLWALGGAVAMTAAFLLGGGALIDLMTTSEEVRAEARAYLPWLGALPLVGVVAWMLDGIFIGATRTRELRDAMILSVAIYAVALVLLPPVFGNHGLWAALMILNLARAATLGLRYPALEAAAARD